MDRVEDSWRVGTCAGGASDNTVINRIMLRFRPIAPKPVDGNCSSGSWKAEEERRGLVTCKRRKRRYVRVKKSMKTAIQPSPTDLKEMNGAQQITTNNSNLLCGSSLKESRRFSSVNEKKVQVQDDKIGDRGVDRVTIDTSVTVESFGDTAVDDARGIGRTDTEKRQNLERDTCPGFISDELSRVEWINEAYRKMVSDGGDTEVRVRLEVKERLLPYVYWYKEVGAFSCWVRLQYTWQKDKWCSKTVPCDVWRLEVGGFAWRLDVQAALELGIQNNTGK